MSDDEFEAAMMNAGAGMGALTEVMGDALDVREQAKETTGAVSGTPESPDATEACWWGVGTRDALAWELHRQWCRARDHGSQCQGPMPQDYADAKAQITAQRNKP